MNKFKTKLGLLSFLILLGGCSSAPKVTELSNTANPDTEMARVEANINEARSRQVDVLSPKNFELAADSIDKAKEARGHNKDQKAILYNIALSQTYLDKANDLAKVTGQAIPGIMAERKNALAADAHKVFPTEFGKIDDSLRETTREIEEGDTSGASRVRAGLEKRYGDVELQSIKKVKLGEARSNVEQAIKEGAKKLAPQTLLWAEKKISEDDAAITANRHNPEIIEKASADAKAAGVRLTSIVRQAKSSSQQNPEQLAVQLENKQIAADTAAAASGAKLSLSQQELADTNKDLDSKNASVAVLSAQNDKLEAKDRLEKQYEFARKQFAKNEAEVYKQGDKLLLRLKGLSFPKGQNVITSNNYPLLAKVQKVIKVSAPGAIVIEGHTDSTGTKEANEKLSAERAEAVEGYLKANNFISSDKISAQGFGYSKPIATNKTATGRAQNRRVDVILTTELAQ